MFEYGAERNRKIILTGFCPICRLDYRIDWFDMDKLPVYMHFYMHCAECGHHINLFAMEVTEDE